VQDRTEEQRELRAGVVHIDEHDLTSEFVRVPADLAYYGAEQVNAQGAYLRAKCLKDRVRARTNIQVRNKLAAEGRKFTETAIEALVELDDEVLAADENLIQADVARLHLQATLEALKSKRDMLVSLGAQIRAEMQQNLHINSASR
jgi:hypothetical protein